VIDLLRNVVAAFARLFAPHVVVAGLTTKLAPPLLNAGCLKPPSGCTCALHLCPKTDVAPGHCALVAGTFDPHLRRVGHAACIGASPSAADAKIARETSIRHHKIEQPERRLRGESRNVIIVGTWVGRAQPEVAPRFRFM
jgi:hypothetical protein